MKTSSFYSMDLSKTVTIPTGGYEMDFFCTAEQATKTFKVRTVNRQDDSISPEISMGIICLSCGHNDTKTAPLSDYIDVVQQSDMIPKSQDITPDQ